MVSRQWPVTSGEGVVKVLNPDYTADVNGDGVPCESVLNHGLRGLKDFTD